MRKHLDEQIVMYGQQVVVNLVSFSSSIMYAVMCHFITDFNTTTIVTWTNFYPW